MKGQKVLEQRMLTFAGEFECHMTVDITLDKIDVFRDYCKGLGGSAIVIELAEGLHSVQPMIAKLIRGDAEQSYKTVLELYRALEEKFNVIRVKVEAATSNRSVPQCDKDAARWPETCYFEHHVRMVLPLDEDLSEFKRCLEPFSAHLSNNPLSTSDIGQVRFATQRFRDLGDLQAAAALNELLTFLSKKHVVVSKVIREFNIYDSNKDLDRGWDYGV